ncbi:hypothetical protein NPIL_112821 [Nephila pilipes]|uniref:Uncharacterized protein n=1 Tax=Nephila pilipes TaxID=299642 RepID=A0A8X6Q163_NEPPI|nr:hypothetical protein NPIL_112821 [Nephila pilipes]
MPVQCSILTVKFVKPLKTNKEAHCLKNAYFVEAEFGEMDENRRAEPMFQFIICIGLLILKRSRLLASSCCHFGHRYG